MLFFSIVPQCLFAVNRIFRAGRDEITVSADLSYGISLFSEPRFLLIQTMDVPIPSALFQEGSENDHDDDKDGQRDDVVCQSQQQVSKAVHGI